MVAELIAKTTAAPARTSTAFPSMAEMVQDALAIHDAECCTAEQPCGLRERLETHRLTYVLNERPDHGIRDPEFNRGKGGQQATSSRPGRLASEKQLRYLSSLFEHANPEAREDLGARYPGILGPTSEFTGQTAAGPVSGELASAMIEILQGKGGAAPSTDATPKQLDLIRKLAGERDYFSLAPKHRDLVTRVIDGGAISKTAASSLIDELFSTAYSSKVSSNGFQKDRGQQPTGPDPDQGIYVSDETGEIISVYRGRQRGTILAKRLVLPKSTDEPGTWEYLGMARRFVEGFRPMTLAEAKAFGRDHEICCRCGARLDDQNSIDAGIGPVCATKGWG